jgi:hypothetical protein
MFLSYALGVIILILVLLRQVRVRPVPRLFRARLPLVLGVIGLFETVAYAGDHHVTGNTWAWVLGSLLIGAVGVGALRGLSMRVWTSHQWVVRQGTAVTMALWLASLILHFVADDQGGARGLEGAGFLLYLGLTLAVQYYVVHRRAQPLWAALGPEAGRPLQFHVSQGPGGMFTFFSTSGVPPNQWVPGPGSGAGSGGAAGHHDRDVIDVEVVDDDGDHGPPELPPPR